MKCSAIWFISVVSETDNFISFKPGRHLGGGLQWGPWGRLNALRCGFSKDSGRAWGRLLSSCAPCLLGSSLANEVDEGVIGGQGKEERLAAGNHFRDLPGNWNIHSRCQSTDLRHKPMLPEWIAVPSIHLQETVSRQLSEIVILVTFISPLYLFKSPLTLSSEIYHFELISLNSILRCKYSWEESQTLSTCTNMIWQWNAFCQQEGNLTCWESGSGRKVKETLWLPGLEPYNSSAVFNVHLNLWKHSHKCLGKYNTLFIWHILMNMMTLPKCVEFSP